LGGRNFREKAGDEKPQSPFDIEVVGKGEEEFPPRFQHSVKFTDGIEGILQMFQAFDTRNKIERPRRIREDLIQIALFDLYMLRDKD
jgi:hypothetical protein